MEQVIVTQIGSMGTLMQARKEEGVSVQPTFHVSILFGKRDEVSCFSNSYLNDY